MNQIRCALLDPESLKKGEPHFEFQSEDGDKLSANEIVDIGQTPWGHKYPTSKKNFIWKLENYTPDVAIEYWQRRCFSAMFRTISFIIPRKYKSVRQNTDKADFNISFKDDIEVFDGKLSVLAHAYLYHPNGSKNGIMEFNDSPESKHYFTPFGDALEAYIIDPINYDPGEKWSNGNLKTLRTQPLLEIGMHELKHNHGYRHNLNEESSLMYPYVKKGWKQVRDERGILRDVVDPAAFTWTESDIKRWEEGYGRRFFPWLGRMRARRLRGRRVSGIPYQVAV